MTGEIAFGDGLREGVEALIPAEVRRFRKQLDDRRAMNGIQFVLHKDIARRHRPRELDRAGEIDWSGEVVDSGHVPALLEAPHRTFPVDRACAGSKCHVPTMPVACRPPSRYPRARNR